MGCPAAADLGNPRSSRPERRTALVARELAGYKADIAALSETRFAWRGVLGPMVSKAPKYLRRTSTHPGEQLLPVDAKEGHVDASSIASVAPAELCPRLEVRPAGRARDKGDSGC
nr:unnamed protein product [Spirometra erinaceieuropaei]